VLSNSVAQTNSDFKIVDATTLEPLGFAHIYNYNSQQGTISNESGKFEIAVSQSDSLRITYLGYQEKNFIVRNEENNLIKLIPVTNTLSEITITANSKNLYDIINKSRELLVNQSTPTKGKAYLLVNTIEENQPIEFSQIFYNTKIYKGSVQGLEFKNGSAHLKPNSKGGWFINLNMSRAFSLYNITKKVSSMPINPFQLSKRKLKKKYNLVQSGITDNYIKIKFTPKESNSNYHSGIAWLDGNNYSLVKLQIVGDNRNKLFMPIGNTSITELNYNISYNFNVQKNENVLNHISINYSSKIDNEIKPRIIRTEAIFHITKFNESYYSPRFQYQEGISDYRAISIIPDSIIYNHISNEGHILLTKKQLKNLEYLQSYGESFQSSQFGEELFEKNYVKWSTDRIIIKKTSKKINHSEVRSIEDRISRYGFSTETDKLQIMPTIYLDLEESADGILVETGSILDTYNSFNHLDSGTSFQVYANIYFDLTELYRRKFLSVISPNFMSIQEIEQEYSKVINELNLQHELLKKESFGGNNLSNLVKWNDLINDELGLDNFEIFNIANGEPATNKR